MRSLFFITSFLSLSILVTFIHCQSILAKEDITCGSVYNDKTGHFQIYKSGTSVPKDNDTTCTWTVKVNDTLKEKSKGIFLFAKSFYLQEKFSLSITVLKNNKSEPYLKNFEGKLEPFGIFASGYYEVNITLTLRKASENGKFQMYYDTTGCVNNLTTDETGVITFPLYEKNVAPFTCDYNLIPASNTINSLHVSFNEFNLAAGHSLKVTGSQGKMDKTYTSADPPSELLASDKLTLSLNITNTTLSSNITLMYDVITEVCSNVLTLSKDEPTENLASPTTDSQNYFSSQKFSCLWILQSDQGTIIKFNLTTVNFTGPSDQILILDGTNQSSPFITRITQANLQDWKTKYIQTSSNKGWVALNSPLAGKNFNVKLDITQTNGGFSSKPGPLTISNVDEAVYLFKFQEGKQVEFSFMDTGNKFPDHGVIKFYKNFEKDGLPLAVYGKNDHLPVVSMEHTMTVVVEKFNGGTINATVSAREPGCFVEESDNAGSYLLQGACNNLCTWKIAPKVNSTDHLQFHFTSLQLSEGDSLAISDATGTSIIEEMGPLRGLPDFITPASGGALVKITRQNCSISKTVVQASFVTNSGCGSEIKALSGETVQIASPNYPNSYPLLANCTFKVSREENKSLHLSFESLKLALPDHVVTLYTFKTEKNKTEKLVLASFNNTMTELPDDYLVNGDIYLEFTSPVTNKSLPLKSASGFSVSVLTLDLGVVLSTTSGIIESPGYPGNVTDGSLFAWVVRVPLMNNTDAQNIISFHSLNQTKEEELKKFLTIYDGPSIRSEPLSNFTNNILLSRTNNMIFLYKRPNLSEKAPAMLFDYQAQACNSSMMCDNKICMHEDWKCNGVNNCGDFSDEKDCQGVAPAPTPKPEPPTPKQSGTSTTALTLGILASLIIGILLGVAAPAAYRRIAGNRFSSYSTFSNTAE